MTTEVTLECEVKSVLTADEVRGPHLDQLDHVGVPKVGEQCRLAFEC